MRKEQKRREKRLRRRERKRAKVSGSEGKTYPKTLNSFYYTQAWLELRYIVLKRYGRECMACGRTEGVMNVDHIKPLRTHWHLRLELDNLQVLCPRCNQGKGHWDDTDFRPEPNQILWRGTWEELERQIERVGDKNEGS